MFFWIHILSKTLNFIPWTTDCGWFWQCGYILAPYPVYIAAWLTPGARDPDHLIHQMIRQMLLTGKNCLLKQRLKQDDNSFLALGMALDSDALAIHGIAIAPRSYASKESVLASLEQILSTPGRDLFTPGI